MKMLQLNDAEMPALGFGTWTLKGSECSGRVLDAIEAGYRHIDTAAMYDNEDAVGEAIRQSGVPRDQLHLTTKVWHTDLAADDFVRSVEGSLRRLGLDYVDLVLIHWPSKSVPLAETIAEMNAVRGRGLARNIGVSNFPTALMDEAVGLSEHPIVCNQVEYHPYLNQDRVLEACARHGMALVSYCPLGRGEMFNESAVAQAARGHGKTTAQVVLRWHMQHPGVGAIPRSSNSDRLRENLAVFDFELSDQEMESISNLRDRNYRICDFVFGPEWDPN